MTPLEPLRAWRPAALIAALIILLVGAAGYLLMQAGLERSTSTLVKETQAGAEAIGRAVAAQFAHALELGIPLDKLPGIERYLERTVAASPQVKGLALLDGEGRALHATTGAGEGLRFPIVVGASRASIVVTPESFLLERGVKDLQLALFITVLLAAAVASCIAASFVVFVQNSARLNIATRVSRVLSGSFAPFEQDGERSAANAASRALATCIERVAADRRQFAAAMATISAIDFDGSLTRRSGMIAKALESRFSFEDAELAQEATSLGGLLWRIAFVLGAYAAVLPLVANFAIDREPVGIPYSWWPVIPLLAELLAAALGALAGSSKLGQNGIARAICGLLLGLSIAATYWCRTYELFVLLRALAGLSAGALLASLLRGGGINPWRRDILALLGFSMLIAGPFFAALCTEAIGRRVAFLVVGAIVLVMAPLVVFGGPGLGPMRHAGGRARANLRAEALLALTALACIATIYVHVPVGIGYDNYLFGAAVVALLGAAALVAPMLPPLACGAAVLLAAAALFSAPGTAQALVAACLALGVGLGAAVKRAATSATYPLTSLGIGAAAGLLAMGLAGAQGSSLVYILVAAAVPLMALQFMPDDATAKRSG